MTDTRIVKTPRMSVRLQPRCLDSCFRPRTSRLLFGVCPSLPLRVLTVSVLLVSVPGCGDKQSPPELMTLEGKIEKIERTSDKTGKLTVLYYNERQKQEMPGTGEVTAETEIMIDGVISTLADLHEGQHVRGEVRVEKKGGRQVQTVMKIKADRAKPTESGD